MPSQNIAVIGGGPKAAALAAKAFCLRQEGYDVTVTIFERDAIGAAWSGRHGYTDGKQLLCTPAERDLGYPYLPAFGASVVKRMQADFSWNAFLTTPDLKVGRYSDWVNRGRRPPTHADFTQYLEFAIEKSEAPVNFGRVTKLSVDVGLWTVTQRDRDTGQNNEYLGFDGIVITGPGPASATSSSFSRVKDPRVFTGVDFWERLVGVKKYMPKDPDKPIVIIGGGGTAAAITAWFIREGYRDQKILLINNQAMLFTRTTNFFESRLFDDEETWEALDPADRRSFTRRLNRGVVWETVTDLLAEANELELVPGQAKAVSHSAPRPGPHLPDLLVSYENATGTFSIDAGLVVDARGFNRWDFIRLLPKALRDLLAEGKAETLSEDLRRDLSLPLDNWPPIHVPNASEAQGPGFGSLMVLGGMTDRILQPYRDSA